jgi:hypothetical protein
MSSAGTIARIWVSQERMFCDGTAGRRVGRAGSTEEHPTGATGADLCKSACTGQLVKNINEIVDLCTGAADSGGCLPRI